MSYFLCIFVDTKNDASAIAVIIDEMHLIKNLKANLLIENDVSSSEIINISNFAKSAYIENCEITIFITIKTKVKSQFKSIHGLKASIILFKSKCLISVHSEISLSNRAFFEFSETNLFVYTHVLDLNTFSILIRNDQD